MPGVASTYWVKPRRNREALIRLIDETGIGDFYCHAVSCLNEPRGKYTHEVYLEAVIQSFLLVFVGEMGDKTQLLALVLAARFRKPWAVMAGIFVATLINHGLSAWAGGLLSSWLSPQALRWLLAAAFFGFAAWVLIPDKDEGFTERGHWGAFLTTTIAFFIAEIGDKTQLATVALGARFSSIWFVTIGTTFGMLAANYLAVSFGHKLLDRIPMKWVHVFASALFVISGLVVLFGF